MGPTANHYGCYWIAPTDTRAVRLLKWAAAGRTARRNSSGPAVPSACGKGVARKRPAGREILFPQSLQLIRGPGIPADGSVAVQVEGAIAIGFQAAQTAFIHP